MQWPRTIYTIEGEIGAGKTELAKALVAELRARGHCVGLVLEPVAEWKRVGILKAFYSDPSRYAYAFQTYVYATRMLAIQEAFRHNPGADLFIFERSPVTDLIFMELQRDDVTPLEMDMYATWCEAWRTGGGIDYSEVRALYLQTSLDVCMARLAGRAREGELVSASASASASADRPSGGASAAGGVSAAYQARLRRGHEAFFLGRGREEFPRMPACPMRSVTLIPPGIADRNFRDPGPERAAALGSVLELMGFPPATAGPPGAPRPSAADEEKEGGSARRRRRGGLSVKHRGAQPRGPAAHGARAQTLLERWRDESLSGAQAPASCPPSDTQPYHSAILGKEVSPGAPRPAADAPGPHELGATQALGGVFAQLSRMALCETEAEPEEAVRRYRDVAAKARSGAAACPAASRRRLLLAYAEAADAAAEAASEKPQNEGRCSGVMRRFHKARRALSAANGDGSPDRRSRASSSDTDSEASGQA